MTASSMVLDGCADDFPKTGSIQVWDCQDQKDMEIRSQCPNQSPEPTAVGACSSAIAVHVASRRWLSFLR